MHVPPSAKTVSGLLPSLREPRPEGSSSGELLLRGLRGRPRPPRGAGPHPLLRAGRWQGDPRPRAQAGPQPRLARAAAGSRRGRGPGAVRARAGRAGHPLRRLRLADERAVPPAGRRRLRHGEPGARQGAAALERGAPFDVARFLREVEALRLPLRPQPQAPRGRLAGSAHPARHLRRPHDERDALLRRASTWGSPRPRASSSASSAGSAVALSTAVVLVGGWPFFRSAVAGRCAAACSTWTCPSPWASCSSTRTSPAQGARTGGATSPTSTPSTPSSP